MKKTLLFLYVFVHLISNTCLCQVSNYVVYRKQVVILNEAMKMLNNDSIRASEKLFISAIKLGPLNTYYAIEALFVFSLVKNDKYIIRVLKEFPNKYVSYCNTLKTICAVETEVMGDSVISNQINTSPKAIKAIAKLRKRQNYTFNKTETKLAAELLSINKLDQQYRTVYYKDIETFPLLSDSIGKVLDKWDSINFIHFISLLKNQGWPSQSKYSDLIEFPLWHCTIENTYLENQAQKAAIRKDLDWETYEHFLRRSNEFVNSLFIKKELALNNLISRKNKITPELEAELHFIIDCFTYYNIKPTHINISINRLDSKENNDALLKELTNIIYAYNSNYRNINLSTLSSNKFSNNQLIITIQK